MSLLNSLLTALRGIAANRLRAGLTALGVVIGVASVIVMLALGNGARAAVDANFSYLGANTIMIAGRGNADPGSDQFSGQPLVYEDGLTIRQEVDQVKLVDMSVYISAKLRFGRNLLDANITGLTEDGFQRYIESNVVQPVGWPEDEPLSLQDFIARGRFFSASEVTDGAQVCVLGLDTATALFQGENPLGQNLRIGRITCLVIGELADLEMVDPAQRYNGQPNSTFYMPISTVVMNFYDEEPSVSMTVEVKDPSKISQTRQEITNMLRKRHGIVNPDNDEYMDDFTMTTRKDLLGAQQDAARTFSILLATMAVVSLVVGGIGIINVMLVSVSERTSEIGIRLAIGAQPVDIVIQFLFESVLISAGGGLFGMVLGILLVPLAATLNGGVALLDPGSLPLAFGVALLTGVAFGLYPAAHASRLNPIEALRRD
ncbi:MAG: FtsX-like permease family protein [Thermotogaceae bacterium]|nr:FtsX-like permease family protein [Thermotogaceae bacterium]